MLKALVGVTIAILIITQEIMVLVHQLLKPLNVTIIRVWKLILL